MTLQTIEVLAAAEKPSTLVIILVPVLIFLAMTAVTAFITYRLRMKKIRKMKQDKADDERGIS